MWVLVVHHVQVVLIRFHVSQQVVRRDVAALRLLVVCVPRERGVSTAPAGGSQGEIARLLPPGMSIASFIRDCATRDQLRTAAGLCQTPQKTLPSLLISVEEESSRIFSVRLSPLLRSSLDSLPKPVGMSFRLKLEKKPRAQLKGRTSLQLLPWPAGRLDAGLQL